MAPWVYDPDTGGETIPDSARGQVKERILAHAAKHYAGRYKRIEVRFRGALCYIDAFQEPRAEIPTHLVRLRYSGDEEQWSLAFYTYSNERYEPCVFLSGKDHGTPEEAFDVGAVYLD